MTDLAKPLTTYLHQYLPHVIGTSKHTVRAYTLTLELLVVFAARHHGTRPSKLTIANLDTGTLLTFLEHLETVRNNSVATRNLRLAAIKAFFLYLEFEYPQYVDHAARVSAIPSKKADQATLDYLTSDEVNAILDAPNRATRTGIRDHAMLYLAYDAGLRISELVNLHLASLNQPELDQVRVMGKGRRRRVLPLWKATSAALHNWIGVRPDGPDQHLFLSSSRKGMTTRGFAKRVEVHVATAATVVPSIAKKTVALHTLRHACAFRILEATNDIRQVSTWLGHADQKTTEIYLRLDPAEKLKIQSRQKHPEISAGSFEGVEDELLAALAKIKASSS